MKSIKEMAPRCSSFFRNYNWWRYLAVLSLWIFVFILLLNHNDLVGVFCDAEIPGHYEVNTGLPCMCYVSSSSAGRPEVGEEVHSRSVNLHYPGVKCAMTIKPIGRLGNLMGEYATLYALTGLSKRIGVIYPEMDRELRKYFSQLSLPAIGEVMTWWTPWIEYRLHDWMDWDEYPIIFQKSTFVKLFGYPSSWTFYHHVRDEILREFTFHPRILSDADDFLREVSSTKTKSDVNRTTFVGVHVRRGDYVELMKRLYDGVVADSNYLEKAIDHFRRRFRNDRLIFVVSSDDIEWCRENIDFSRGDVIEAWDIDAAAASSDRTYPRGDPGRDLALLTRCNHTIMTIGTFGFWAAYLAGGEVVYLANYTRPGSVFNDVFKPEAAYLPNWVGIPAKL